MKKLATLLALALLTFPGCSNIDSNQAESPTDNEITGDHDIGTQPEDLDMPSTYDTSDLDPFEEGEISEEAQQEIQDIINADQAASKVMDISTCEELGGSAIPNGGTENATCPDGSEYLGGVNGFYEGGICCSN